MGAKLIFLDIDGTLTEPGKNTPPDSALDAIRKAQSKGHKVFLCSGRNYGMLSPLLKYGFDGFIGSTGGYIEYEGEVIYDCPMTASQQKRTMDILEQNGIFRTIEGKDGSFSDEGLKEFLKEKAKEGGNSELLRIREELESDLGIRPMGVYDGQPIYKIVFMCSSTVQLQDPRRLLEDEFKFCIQDSDQFGIINGELINRAFDKGTAIQKICDHLDMDIEDTIAFGDSMNDLEMIQTAHIGVCMANGSNPIKEVSDMICPPVTEDGLYKGFEELNLF